MIILTNTDLFFLHSQLQQKGIYIDFSKSLTEKQINMVKKIVSKYIDSQKVNQENNKHSENDYYFNICKNNIQFAFSVLKKLS